MSRSPSIRSQSSRSSPSELADRLARAEHRLRGLDRSQRRLRLFLLLLTAGLGALALAPAQRVVEAGAFVVRDDEGRPRAQLAFSDGVPALSLYDEDGALRGAFAVESTGPILNLFSPEGHPRAVIAERDRRSFVVLRDAGGAPRAAMAVQEDGHPSLYLLDDQLTPIWRQPLELPQR